MSGKKKFKVLRDQLNERLANDPAAGVRFNDARSALRDTLALVALREARGQTQNQLASTLNMSQSNVSRVEHEEDVYLSTLRRYVAALGGQLEVSAVFPDETVRLDVSQPISVKQSRNLKRATEKAQ